MRASACWSEAVGAARFGIGSRTNSCTRPTATARVAARRLVRRSSRLPGSSGLEITEGLDALLVVGDEELNDTRCRACGSRLFSVVRDGAYVHVALGTLVDAPAIRPTKHIFVGSKAAWFEITDDLPQFEEHAVVVE